MKRCLTSIGFSIIFLLNISSANQCERIVALSPSISEIISELGMGNKVVGNTAELGQISEPNLIAIKQLNPTVIFFEDDVRDKERELYSKEGLVIHQISLHSLETVLNSYQTILSFCDLTTEAINQSTDIQSALNHVNELKKLHNTSPTNKRLLVLYENSDNTNFPKHAAGQGAHRDLLQFLGVSNYLYLRDMERPLITQESFDQLSPEITFVFTQRDIKSYESKGLGIPKLNIATGNDTAVQATLDGYPIVVTTPKTLFQLADFLTALLMRINQ